MLNSIIPAMQIRRIILSLSLTLLTTPFLDAQIVQVTDIALETGFQDTVFGHHKRGRAGLAADFNLDGYIDFYVGNPGDESYVMVNTSNGNGDRVFVSQQILVTDSLAWGGVAFDYDNDGDYDLFITCGANEGIGYDYLFRNDWILNGIVTGNLSFTDVTSEAGVAGPLPPGSNARIQRPSFITIESNCCAADYCMQEFVLERPKSPPELAGDTPVRTSSANARVADYDQDGDNDIFVNGNIHPDSDQNYPELIGRNTLWRNNGDGTFTDVTYEAGLGTILAATRHSTWLDYDNDGDPDLYENNRSALNYLWRNNGDGTFTDVTSEASAPGDDLHFPFDAFVSAAADLNNDGWGDIIGFMRGENDWLQGSPYEDGHTLFINNQGVFENVAASTVINDIFPDQYHGVMGCMVGDVSGDGLPDIYVGNGGPPSGYADQFFESVAGTDTLTFVDKTSLIDFPAIIPPGFPEPPYPYRTHGTSFFDIDNDGNVEIAVVNGGPAQMPDSVREPNRLFKLETATPYNWFKVRPVGNGTTVALDAIGTRIALEVSRYDGEPWTVYQTLQAGNAFSAQNGFVLHFGLSDADTILSMNITWPNGVRSVISEGLYLNSSVVVNMDDVVSEVGSGTQAPVSFRLDQNHPNPFNPNTTIGYALGKESHITITVYDVLGQHVTTLVDGVQSQGHHSVLWDGTNSTGQPVSTGVYLYRMRAGDYVASRKTLMAK